jgi:hypothetical protein
LANNNKTNCTQCGKSLLPDRFYRSRNKKYSYNKRLPICKDCAVENYLALYNETNSRKEAMIRTCAVLDMAFSDVIFEMSMNAFATRGSTEESSFPAIYISFLNSNTGKNAGDSFLDSEIFNKLFESGEDVSHDVKFKYNRAEEDIINLNSQINDLEVSKVALSKESELLKAENGKLQSRLTSAETQFATLKISSDQEVARKEGLKIKLESEISRINSELSISKQNLANSDRQLKEKSDELLNLQKSIKSFDKQILVLENDAEVANKNLEKYTAEKEKEISVLSSKYENDTTELKVKISKLLIEIEDLKFVPKKEEDEVEDVLQEKIPEEYIFEWGNGFNLDDYKFLNKKIEVWKEKHEIVKESEDVLLHKIVILELKIRKKESTGDDTSDDLKLLQNLMKTANFVEKKSVNAQSSGGKFLIGLAAEDMEKYEPAEWYEDQKKFKDIEGIDEYLKTYVTRPLKNFITGSRDFDSVLDNLQSLDGDPDDE